MSARVAAISSLSRFQRRDGVLHQDVSGSLMLYNMEEGQYFALGDVGTRIWELSDGSRSLGDIVAILCDEYDAPQATIHDDVVGLMHELSDEHLVVELVVEADAQG